MKIIADTDQEYALVVDDKNEFVNATSFSHFFKTITSSNSSVDTGLMPQDGSGILSYRSAGAYSQLVYQQAPGSSLVKWGQYENDDDAKVYKLAHPYKIFIADFHSDTLVGLRHFFANEAIFDGSEILYHTPYPNTNCQGYNGTSVGWVCLYRTSGTPLLTVSEKLDYAWQRESGLHEPYNNDNMSETDGPRFYYSNGINIYNDPEAWQNKTLKEGFDWISDTDFLIPIKTNDEHHLTHDDEGVVYTLDKAMNDSYIPYYSDSLSENQLAFYQNGWTDIAIDNVFDPNIVSRLNIVDPPQEVDPQSLLESYNIFPVDNIDFKVFNNDVKQSYADFVLNSRSQCLFCESFSSQMHYLALNTRTQLTDSNLFKDFIIHKDLPYIFGVTSPDSDQPLVAQDYTCCTDCINLNKYAVLQTTIESPIEFNDIRPVEVAVLTQKGANFVASNLNLPSEVFNLSYDSTFKSLEDINYSRFFVQPEDVDYLVPEQHTVKCLQCDSFYLYGLHEENSDYHGTPDFIHDSHIAILNNTAPKHMPVCQFVFNCNDCSQHALQLSDFALSSEDLGSEVDNLGYKLGTYIPFEDAKWMFRNTLFEEKSLIINSYETSDVYFVALTDCQQAKNFLVEILEDLKYGFQTVYPVPETSSFYPHAEMFERHDLKMAVEFDDDSQEYFISSKQIATDDLITCACKIDVNSLELCENFNHKGFPVCNSCVKDESDQPVYVPIITKA